jgi:hypothetical protein
VLAVSVAVMFGLHDNISRAVIEDLSTDALAQTTGVMLGATIVLVPHLLRQTSALARFRTAFPAFSVDRQRRPEHTPAAKSPFDAGRRGTERSRATAQRPRRF